MRELITFSAIICLGGCEPQAKAHASANISVGNTKKCSLKQLLSVCHLSVFPRTLNAIGCISAVVNKFYLDMSWRKEECKMRNLNFKVIVDGMLIVTLLLSMAYLLIGIDNHEIVGTVFFILFIVHIILNRRWFFSVFKGKYSGMRIFFIGLNFLIFVMMIGLIISGMIFATYTPNFIKIANSIEMARLLHLLTAYWCFVLLSLHLGTNLTPIVNAIKLNDMYKE